MIYNLTILQSCNLTIYQSAPGPDGNFSLSAGVSSVLSQLLPSCSSEKQFRALNLDITCPPSLPTVTACHCLTKNHQGNLVSKISGKIDYKVKY